MAGVDVGDRTQRVVITEDVASRIHRLLVKYSEEDHNKRIAFIQTMAETGIGRDQEWWEVKAGYWGITKFFMCSDEWYVITSQEDESPKTREAVDLCNLALAQLRDVIDAEQNP
jgi:hypothetical protein